MDDHRLTDDMDAIESHSPTMNAHRVHSDRNLLPLSCQQVSKESRKELTEEG